MVPDENYIALVVAVLRGDTRVPVFSRNASHTLGAYVCRDVRRRKYSEVLLLLFGWFPGRARDKTRNYTGYTLGEMAGRE